RLHALLHGLTAPAFLFGAGLAFGITSYARYEAFRTPGRALQKRLRRYALLLVIGYALQLPGGSLWAALHAQGDKLLLVFRVGPLQLIAVTLGACQLAMLASRSARRHALACAGAAGVIAWLATPVYTSGLSQHVGGFLGAYLDDRVGSQFPIFPWASFALLGVAGGLAVRERPALAGRWALLVAGGALALGAYACFYYRLVPYEKTTFWRCGVTYVLFRLGSVLALLGLFTRAPAAAPTRHDERAGAGALLARHSLVAYVVHLLLLYGTPFTPNLARLYGGSLSLAQTGLACALMIAVTVAAVYAWDFLQREPVWLTRIRRVAAAAAGVVLLRP
ncbi:MAG TPA: heparan-alpha-glucosaminide N-acetyltransferase domain-containing protein, partial [Polyangiales bacterium]